MKYRSAIILLTATGNLAVFLAGCGQERPGGSVHCSERRAVVFPDYAGVVIPPNIAPLNFVILEKGRRFQVVIRSPEGDSIVIAGRKPGIVIPESQWRSLLRNAAGKELSFEVSARASDGWIRYRPFTDTVAAEPIDRYLVYRKINICVKWMNMGIFERDVGSFGERPLMSTGDMPGACMNCHSFRQGRPDGMAVQLRSRELGTPLVLLLSEKGGRSVQAVDTKTGFTSGRAGFTAWHPSAPIMVFSVNSFTMLYHTAAREVREVFDQASDLALYRTGSCTVEPIACAAAPDRVETMPEWSPDGRCLYFCSGPQIDKKSYTNLRCDLMRVSWDAGTDSWGRLDTVMTAARAGGSITQPRVSPDGRKVLLTLSSRSDFPVHQAQSHLFLLTLDSGTASVIDSTGDFNDAWHGWSSNGRWIVFSSKRMDRRFSRPFFRYVDKSGAVHKPFVLPQRDPSFYRSCILAYNIPELVTGRVSVARPAITPSLLKKGKKKAAAPVSGPPVNHPAGDAE